MGEQSSGLLLESASFHIWTISGALRLIPQFKISRIRSSKFFSLLLSKLQPTGLLLNRQLNNRKSGLPEAGEKRTLNPEQEHEMISMLVDHDPAQFKLKGCMWTRDSVRELIKVKYGITMPNRTVGEYLRRWGFTVQRPAKRESNQKLERVETWLTEEYPTIRRKPPHDQADPDMFVHIVERRSDGIVVCGAKAHQTGSINSHWHIFMPTIAMGEADKDWAVSFACPSDAEGMYMIYGRQSCDTRKLEEGGCIDQGNAKFGGQEALVVLDHVFIPNEYIFLNGEYEFAGMMVERFAGYHRQSYGGCKVGVGDVVIGAAALAAEYNGVEKASHIKDKLIEMTHLNETLYSCGIACSCEGCPTKAGNYQIDLLLANVCKQNITRFPYEIVRLAEDIAGGLMVTMPSEKDFTSDTVVGRSGETIGDICNKYFAGREGVSTKDRQKIMRFLENICLGSAAVGYRTESLHGAGSPQAQRVMIARQSNIQNKKQLARFIAGINTPSE